ncbi:contact-dependent growth inhibition system immunity protein [Acinetobacter faecalis]|uniref:contact-dependent growth inhibition system immunity protein n=1 Tax=Acinetobacter faecalis TaxID=2665161 RepID=UPI002A913474|nr:contact-dependent growth inhibition system immunity protein [Acinetobacter faecalis]MDY6451135.1 contact-dependent growth inhibition system immunity protein [Acinetobacter faecalis]MDY6481540.1 contact-dependent growth inhibition system immunity protein [Acinetobacter faecalis]
MNQEAMLVFGGSFIKLITYINAGLSIVDKNYDPIILDIECTNEELGWAVKKALIRSTVIEDGGERSRICQESMLNQDAIKNKMNDVDSEIRKKYGYKNKKKYEQDLMYIFLKLNKKEYTFSPSHTDKDGSTSLDKDFILSLSISDEEMGLEARKAMSLCTSIYK